MPKSLLLYMCFTITATLLISALLTVHFAHVRRHDFVHANPYVCPLRNPPQQLHLPSTTPHRTKHTRKHRRPHAKRNPHQALH